MNACGFDRFDFYGCLDRVESAIANEIRWRIGPSDFPNTFGGMANWAGFDFGQRARRVQEAINESQSIAIRNLHTKLGAINLPDIWPLLADICHDLALYIGGGAIAGAAIGSGLGFMVLGVGAIPGAVAGTVLGAKLGGMLLNLIGLKPVIEYMIDNVPLAIDEYQKGFVDAWGPVPSLDGHRMDRLPSNYYFGSSGFAAHSFARGHEIMVIALLMGIVAYLGRGKGNLKALLAEAQSGRLGPKFATWLEKNAETLTSSPMLRVRRNSGGQADSQNLRTEATGHQQNVRAAKPPAPQTDPKHAHRIKVGPVALQSEPRLATRAENSALYRIGAPAASLERNFEHALNPQMYVEDIAAHYKINLIGSGQKIQVVFDETLASGRLGVTYAAEGGRIIRVGPDALSSQATTANTIAHELSHARDYLRGAHKPHGSNGSVANRTPYGSGNALQEWIEGKR